VLVDEHDVDAAGAGGDHRGRPRQADVRLAGGHGLKDRGRAIDRLDVDRETVVFEVAFADRHPHREDVDCRRIGNHDGDLFGRLRPVHALGHQRETRSEPDRSDPRAHAPECLLP
jgi:hypothetical protein